MVIPGVRSQLLNKLVNTTKKKQTTDPENKLMATSGARERGGGMTRVGD